MNALVWAVLALASVALRDEAGATVLLWMPSGITVGALFAAPVRRWPTILCTFFPVQVAVFTFNGTAPGMAALYSLAALSQASVAAWLSVRVLESRRNEPSRFRQVVGLFGAAMIGSLVGTCLAFGMRDEQTLAEFSWWFFANVIGIMTVAPIYLKIRRALLTRGRGINREAVRELALVIPLFGLLSFLVLEYQTLALAPLVVTALVLITFRYGHQSSAISVLAFAVAATVVSMHHGNAAPAADLSQREATLTLQAWMMILLATRLPLAAMMARSEGLQMELLERNAQMHESLMLFDLAEETAGIGRWRLNLVTGEQDWSPKMLELTGIPENLGPDPGDVSDMMPDGGEEFYGAIRDNRENRDTYSFSYRVKPPNQTERILRIAILNEFDLTGKRISVFGVAMDVTEQVRREEALDLARSRAVRLAAEAQKLANTDPLTSLPNRRCTFGRLESMIEVAETRDGALAAIMFDVDHFKQVNDVYGHQTGDEVLVQVAELARRQARSGDLVGRIGGEEFVWLLPGISEDASPRLAERLRRSVESGIEGSTLPDVTVSIGIANFRKGDSGESLLARADAALYEAKESGRNQVKRAA
ncbi:sensor domain-containing diguanylate cyclase [Aurantiacibacter gangjinensis]|uniref:sensor domain-containing diguanylate cyclase n=1 Tax=Aurantiacibacter gangjinensis TaxID=502682 RepID=UPI00069C1C9E|nr:sensor domain-containing diguanylate cyclase [Aurantiacibacter gangjinensis]APE28274.1 GGDEF domain protein [Aurantiacibacter gangjinensis]